MTLLEFAKELKKGDSEHPAIQKIISEALNYIEKKKNAGRSGGIAKASSAIAVLGSAIAESSIPLARNSNKSSTVTKTATIDPDHNTIPYGEILADLNQKGSFRYQVCDSTKRHINARFSEGYKLEDFFHVHSVKIAQWKGTKDAIYLRPETLYGNKFQGYLNQKLPQEENAACPSWY